MNLSSPFLPPNPRYPRPSGGAGAIGAKRRWTERSEVKRDEKAIPYQSYQFPISNSRILLTSACVGSLLLLFCHSETFASDDRAVFDSDFKYPAYAESLHYLGREATTTRLVFTGSKPPAFQIWWEKADGVKVSAIVKKGESFGKDGRFTVESYSEKRGFHAGIEADLSELTILDAEGEKVFILEKDKIVSIPTYFAIFQDPGSAPLPPVKVQEGKLFPVPGDPRRTAKALAVSPDSVRIRCEEKEFTISKGKLGAVDLVIFSEGRELSVYIPKDLVLDFSGSQPGIPPGLPTNVTYQAGSFFWGLVIAGPKTKVGISLPSDKAPVPLKVPATPAKTKAP